MGATTPLLQPFIPTLYLFFLLKNKELIYGGRATLVYYVTAGAFEVNNQPLLSAAINTLYTHYVPNNFLRSYSSVDITLNAYTYRTNKTLPLTRGTQGTQQTIIPPNNYPSYKIMAPTTLRPPKLQTIANP